MKAKVLAVILIFSTIITLFLPLPAYAESLTLDTTQGVVGSDVKIPAFCQYGTGDYFLYWGDNNQLITQGTVTTSSCQPITFKVPQAARGKHMVTLKIGSKTFQKEFTVLPSISLDTKKGTVGSSISVQGSGFDARETNIKIFLDGNEVATGIEANSNGGWLHTLKIPPTSRGNHPITASGSTTPLSELKEQIFNITPNLSLNPNSGWVGRVTSVAGTGFNAAETNITILYDDVVAKTGITADLTGSWQSSFSVPASARGPHKVDARGATTLLEDVPDATFTVSPGIKVEQATGRLGDVIVVGDTLWVSGVGFQENENGIKVTFDNMQVVGDITADARGSWSAQFQVPAATHGEHVVDAFGDATRADDVTDYIVVLTPTVTINPNTGSVGTNTILSGTAFGSNQPLTITYDSKSVDIGITTDVRGSFSTSFKPPLSSSGSHLITISDPSQAVASIIFTIEAITPPTPKPIAPSAGTKTNSMDNTPLEFKWTPVEDPSGVYYTLEISQKADFSRAVLRKENLETPGYTLATEDRLEKGEYFWRVKAIDGAGNSSDWSQSQLLLVTGFDLWWIGLIAIIIGALIGIVVWRIRAIGKKGGWSSND